MPENVENSRFLRVAFAGHVVSMLKIVFACVKKTAHSESFDTCEVRVSKRVLFERFYLAKTVCTAFSNISVFGIPPPNPYHPTPIQPQRLGEVGRSQSRSRHTRTCKDASVRGSLNTLLTRPIYS